MSKKKTIGIVIIAIVGVLVVFYAIGASRINASNAAAADLAKKIAPVNANQPPEVEAAIQNVLANDPNRLNDINWRQTALNIIVTGNTGDTAKLVIHASGAWTGALMDGTGVQRTVSGGGIVDVGDSYAIDFDCPGGGIFSVSIQQTGRYDTLNVYVAQAGRILEQAGTDASYGVVSFAGNCA